MNSSWASWSLTPPFPFALGSLATMRSHHVCACSLEQNTLFSSWAIRAAFLHPPKAHVFLYKVVRLSFVQSGQMNFSIRFSPTSLFMLIHSPWNQSSQFSQHIIHRWSSAPRHRQYGPWSDSSSSDPADSWASPAEPDRVGLALFAALGPPVFFDRLGVFLTVEAVPFFFEAV